MSVEDGIAALQGLLGRVSRIEGMIPQFRWGQVTSVAGLEVQLDGPGLPVPITSTLVRPAVGDRVLVLFWLRRSVILGVAGGRRDPVILTGEVALTPRSPATNVTSADVVFDKPLPGTPRVMLTLASAAGGTQKYVPRSLYRSPAGFTAYIYSGDGSNLTANALIEWVAIYQP